MKENNNNKDNNKKDDKKTGLLDLAALDKSLKVDVFSVPSLIQKIRTSHYFSSLPDWIENYVIPPGTVACPEQPAKCMAKLVVLQRTKAFNVAPVYQADLVMTTNDVAISNLGMSYKDGEKTISLGVSVGYLVPDLKDSLRIIHASTADIVATDAKYDKKGNITIPEWPSECAVPRSNSLTVREFTQSTVSSRSKARDEIFSFLNSPSNQISGLRMHSIMSKDLANFTEHSKMTELLLRYYKAKKIAVPDDPTVRVVGIDNGPLPFTEEIGDAYKLYFKSVGIRGGRDGKNVSHGFERFSMSRTLSNTLNLLHDFINMSERYGSRTVLVKDSTYLTVEHMRVLKFNGFRIVHAGSYYGKCLSDSPPGIYGSYDPKVKLFEFIVLPDNLMKPTIENKVIKLGVQYEEALSKLSKRNRCFTYVYLDKRMLNYKKIMSFLPSATADTMQIIVATGLKETYEFEKFVKRATMAISCRNRFVHTRKTFSTVDIMHSAMKWDRILRYPALQKNDDNKKFLDLNKSPVADRALTVVPLDVNLEDFIAMVESEVASSLTLPEMVYNAAERDCEYFLRVFIGSLDHREKGSSVYAYVDDGGASWDSAWDPILELSENNFIRVLDVQGMSGVVKKYHELSALIYSEDVASDGDEDSNNNGDRGGRVDDDNHDVLEEDEDGALSLLLNEMAKIDIAQKK